MEAIVSNIGGTSTLIGDPPNIIIGSQAGLSFNSFLVHLGPIVLVIFIVFLVTLYFIFGKRYNVPEEVKARVKDAIPHLAIVDKKMMIRSLSIFALIFLGFSLHNLLHVQAGVIALGGSMLMLLVCRSESEDALMSVEWGVVFFFIGMLIMI
jgi:Na+/H+ antiporter NhaD/arsenite permease-like protein